MIDTKLDYGEAQCFRAIDIRTGKPVWLDIYREDDRDNGQPMWVIIATWGKETPTERLKIGPDSFKIRRNFTKARYAQEWLEAHIRPDSPKQD